MVSSHLRHFGTLSSAGEGVGWTKKVKVSTFFKHINLSSHFLSIFFWEQECETETYSISLKASVVLFASIFQINFILVCSLALIFALVFLLLYFCPQCFALALFLPSSFALALKMSAKKRAREKSLFCPLIHFPMYFALKFCHCPCPLFLPSCSGQKKRARARAKFEGKIHGEMNQRAKIDFALALFFC